MVRTFLAIVLAAGAALAAGCGGGGSDGAPAGAARLVGPSEFAAAVEEPGRVTVNVHIPDEGSIEGTDLWIPFDRVEALRDELPEPGTPIALYCRSGNMSAEAAPVLARLGFTDIVELEGGFQAWEADGLPLLAPGSR